MASAFASALEALFADAHLASDIVYIAEGGAPSLVRAILRRPDDVTSFGEARIWSGVGPMNLMPCSPHISAKRAFSAKKP